MIAGDAVYGNPISLMGDMLDYTKHVLVDSPMFDPLCTMPSYTSDLQPSNG